MTGANELTSPAPKVIITSPGSADSITLSVASMKLGMYSPLLIASVINREVTPDRGFSLAAYISRTITRSASDKECAKPPANAAVREYLCGWKMTIKRPSPANLRAARRVTSISVG